MISSAVSGSADVASAGTRAHPSRCARVPTAAEAGVSSPPACDTGAEVTTANHWLRGTSDLGFDTVLSWLTGFLNESVVVLDRGMMGYSNAYLVGSVKVLEHPGRPDMGVCVDISGSACEELGLSRLASIFWGLNLRVSRLDLALDNCPFAPALLRDEWQADRVRTRCKIPEKARDDRQWRSCGWHESPTGDTFEMGSRDSSQFARCYDSRGFTRFELELKGKAAHAAALELFPLVEDPAEFMQGSLGWVRRFVDFVDPASDENASRRTLLPFWEEFIQMALKARVTLEPQVVRTAEDALRWLKRQVAPVLAVVESVYSWDEVAELVGQGRQRWRSRHLQMVGSPG